MTRYLWEASSGNFTLLADYLLPPDSGVFRLTTTTGQATAYAAIQAVNTAMGATWNTVFGHNSPGDYDHWSFTTSGTLGPGMEKAAASDSKYDHVFFIFRNSGGNVHPGSGYADHTGFSTSLMGRPANTYSIFGARNSPPVKLMCHEFCHLLFGDNKFHCAGGGNNTGGAYVDQYWISQVGGWSLMGLANRSMDSWCGWDRLRMGWKAAADSVHPGHILARDSANVGRKVGDLDATDPVDAGVYVLRDFVATGDALRIKVPFTDPVSEYPEWIWVENHQGRNQNGHLFDKWQFEDNACVQPLEPGLYMYMQIDRDNHVETSVNALYGGYEDYLRPLIASGHYDITYQPDTVDAYCVCWECPNLPFTRTTPNPLTGMGDTHWDPYDRNGDGMLNRSAADYRTKSVEYMGGAYWDQSVGAGHTRHGFRPGHNTKLGIGTNPSSASAMNLVGGNGNVNPLFVKNHRKIQLNGLSVELLAQLVDRSIRVRVRFDDVDVANDVRWCAPEIVLNPVATASGHSLNLKSGHTLTLDQGTTATRRNSAMTYNGQAIFTSPTLLRCTDQSWFNLEANSEVVVDNGSTLRLESGSRLDVASGAVLRVKHGGALELEGGSVLNVAAGGRVVIEEDPLNNLLDGTLRYHPGARINVEGTTGEVEIAGQLVIGPGATFTIGTLADATQTRGKLRFTSARVPSYNVVSAADSRFELRSNAKQRRVLHVEQEQLYFDALEAFVLEDVTAALISGARIVPAETAACTVRVANARVTSMDEYTNNAHQGLWLAGQPNTTLEGSTFSRGELGLRSVNTLGAGPHPLDCEFSNCTIGWQNVYRRLAATDCRFNYNGTGISAEHAAWHSELNGCSGTRNTTVVRFQGPTTLHVVDAAFNGNDTGIELREVAAHVECGTISENSLRGIHVRSSAGLRMGREKTETHDPVTMLDNGITVELDNAHHVYLYNGHNQLAPLITGMQNTLKGTMLCGTLSPQPAAYNNWEGTPGTPLATTEYHVTANCPYYPSPVIVFTDAHGAAGTPCGQAIPPCPRPPCEEPGLKRLDCPDCRTIETEVYGVEALHEASALALAMAEADSVVGNQRIAVDGLGQIIGAELEAPNADEYAVLHLDQEQLRRSLSAALSSGQVAAEAADTLVLQALAAHDRLIALAEADSNVVRRQYLRMDKAWLLRNTGSIDASIELLATVLADAAEEDQEEVARVHCLAVLERDLLNGVVRPHEVTDLASYCLGGATRSLRWPASVSRTTSTTADATGLWPNPTSGTVSVRGFEGCPNQLEILDLAGRVVADRSFTSRMEVDLPLAPGLYTYRITDKGDGAHRRGTGHLVITR